MKALALILSLRLRIFAAGRKIKALAKFQIQRQGNTSPRVSGITWQVWAELHATILSCPAPAARRTAALLCVAAAQYNSTHNWHPDLLLPPLTVSAPCLQFLYLPLCYCFMFAGARNGFTFFEKHPTLPISDHLLGTAVTEVVQIK